MSAWAKPGVKCVFLGIPPGKYVAQPESIHIPEAGAVLTVRDVRQNAQGETCLRFVEIINPTVATQCGTAERGYEAFCFRPLITRTQEQDLELFRPLLVPNPVDAGLVPAGVELDA